MARLLDSSVTGSLSIDPVIGTKVQNSDQTYLDELVGDVEDNIAQYLHYNPVLAVHENEEGAVELALSGVYAGRYLIELQHQPLIPGKGPDVFTYLTFTYAAAFQFPGMVDRQFIQLIHNTGQVYALSPGLPEGLAGIAFGAGNTVPSVWAAGYQGTYAAGWATGINDPVPDGGGIGFSCHVTLTNNGSLDTVVVDNHGFNYVTSPVLVVSGTGGAAVVATRHNDGTCTAEIKNNGAGYTSPPTVTVSTATTFGASNIPRGIKRAALLLLREAMIYDIPASQIPNVPTAGGYITGIKDEVQEIRFSLYPAKRGGEFELGYGSPLSKAAERLIFPYKRRRIALLLV